MAPAQRLVTFSQLRTIFGIEASRFTIRRWWMAGQMPMPQRLGGRLVWREDDLVAWLANLPTAIAKKAKR